jgi:hypothetical protein
MAFSGNPFAPEHQQDKWRKTLLKRNEELVRELYRVKEENNLLKRMIRHDIANQLGFKTTDDGMAAPASASANHSRESSSTTERSGNFSSGGSSKCNMSVTAASYDSAHVERLLFHHGQAPAARLVHKGAVTATPAGGARPKHSGGQLSSSIRSREHSENPFSTQNAHQHNATAPTSTTVTAAVGAPIGFSANVGAAGVLHMRRNQQTATGSVSEASAPSIDTSTSTSPGRSRSRSHSPDYSIECVESSTNVSLQSALCGIEGRVAPEPLLDIAPPSTPGGVTDRAGMRKRDRRRTPALETTPPHSPTTADRNNNSSSSTARPPGSLPVALSPICLTALSLSLSPTDDGGPASYNERVSDNLDAIYLAPPSQERTPPRYPAPQPADGARPRSTTFHEDWNWDSPSPSRSPPPTPGDGTAIPKPVKTASVQQSSSKPAVRKKAPTSKRSLVAIGVEAGVGSATASDAPRTAPKGARPDKHPDTPCISPKADDPARACVRAAPTSSALRPTRRATSSNISYTEPSLTAKVRKGYIYFPRTPADDQGKQGGCGAVMAPTGKENDSVVDARMSTGSKWMR